MINRFAGEKMHDLKRRELETGELALLASAAGIDDFRAWLNEGREWNKTTEQVKAELTQRIEEFSI